MFSETLKKTAEPVTRLNKLMMDTATQVGEYQMNLFKEYAQMAGDQARALTEVRDVESFQQYMNKQAEFFGTVVEKASEDLQEMSRIAQQFREEATQVFQPETAANESGQETKTPAKPAQSAQSKSTSSKSSASAKA
ncbi:phasin family protein [Marinobacteraceae bacterium S3BR75-40.1]